MFYTSCRDGLQAKCRDCTRSYNAAYYRANKEALLEKMRSYYQRKKAAMEQTS